MGTESSKIFASNLFYLRKKKNLNRTQLSVLIDINEKSIESYENNRSNPSIDRLIIISDFFGISADKLLKVNLKEVSKSYK